MNSRDCVSLLTNCNMPKTFFNCIYERLLLKGRHWHSTNKIFKFDDRDIIGISFRFFCYTKDYFTKKCIYLRTIYAINVSNIVTQPIFTCSKSTKETLRTRREIRLKLAIKTPERLHWHRSGVVIVNFEHISHLVLMFLLLTLNM